MPPRDLNDVRIFTAAVEAGTFSAAGIALGVPPSTVSRSLTRIEKDLGICLVHRDSRGIHLTDSGRAYLKACKRALSVLREGAEMVREHRARPKGLIKVACPVTMARDLLAPLLKIFLERYPDLRVELASYCSGFEQEPREDEEIDVFFKLRAPRDSLRRVRWFPGTALAMFASRKYLDRYGEPCSPEQLAAHRCIGLGAWKLSRNGMTITPEISFCIVSGDPYVQRTLASEGLGICVLPLWLVRRPECRDALVPVLPEWRLPDVTLCALFSGQTRVSPKVKALLDFLAEYIGTDRDPRLRESGAGDVFSPPAV